MLTIHKYQFDVADKITITMPRFANVLKFDNQNEKPTLWALVNTENEESQFNFLLFGTGMRIPEFISINYIGSAQFADGKLVWHLFMAT